MLEISPKKQVECRCQIIKIAFFIVSSAYSTFSLTLCPLLPLPFRSAATAAELLPSLTAVLDLNSIDESIRYYISNHSVRFHLFIPALYFAAPWISRFCLPGPTHSPTQPHARAPTMLFLVTHILFLSFLLTFRHIPIRTRFQRTLGADELLEKAVLLFAVFTVVSRFPLRIIIWRITFSTSHSSFLSTDSVV